MGYRKILDRVRTRVPVKHYDRTCSVSGDVPDWLSGRLPLFGSEDSNEFYLNSGGRGILIEKDGETCRLKGVDPIGLITRKVAASEKNLVADIRSSVEFCPEPYYMENRLNRLTRFGVSLYKGKPFNFLMKDAVGNSKRVFDAMNEDYGKHGFSHPCTHAGNVEYPGILWGEEPVYSIVFRLDSMESDLRECELTTLMRKHLQHASVEQLKDLKERIEGFYRKLMAWHAFECRLMADHGFVPTGISMIDQNYTISRVSGDSGIGIARVDHTSTKEHRLNQEELFRRVTDFRNVLCMMPIIVEQAIEMDELGIDYDRERYSSRFDASFKFRGEMDGYPKTCKLRVSMEEEFKKLYEERRIPEPVEESEMLSLYSDIMSIKLDEEFERRREERYREFLKGKGLEQILAAKEEKQA